MFLLGYGLVQYPRHLWMQSNLDYYLLRTQMRASSDFKAIGESQLNISLVVADVMKTKAEVIYTCKNTHTIHIFIYTYTHTRTHIHTHIHVHTQHKLQEYIHTSHTTSWLIMNVNDKFLWILFLSPPYSLIEIWTVYKKASHWLFNTWSAVSYHIFMMLFCTVRWAY